MTDVDGLAGILRRLGGLLLEWRAEGATAFRREGSQYKADADSRAHEFLTRELGRIDRGIPIVSEEDPASIASARPARYWLIDPIDGTASFVGGYTGFVTQAALIEDAQPVLGCVFAPETDELFCAFKGHDATRNSVRLNVDPNSRGSIIDNYPTPQPIVARAMRDMSLGDYIESGSIGLKICRVADGTAALFFKDVVVRDWDIAPGLLILEEAGGALSRLDGSPFSFDGSFEKSGMIAASSVELLRRVVAWHSHIRSDAASQGE